MLLKAVAIALLVPPTSLVFVALVGLLIERRLPRVGRLLAWLGFLACWSCRCRWWRARCSSALEQDLPLTPPTEQPPQAIVILGGDVRRAGGQPPTVHLGPLSIERVLAGAVLARRTGLPLLVSGGKLEPSDPPIAMLMADSLEHDFQVPAPWVEPVSLDTWENAQMSAAILHTRGIRSIYLVTHAWHMRRAIVAFAGTGITVTAAPTYIDRLPSPLAVDFVPEVGAWRLSYFALHEWLGLAWYATR